MNNEAYIIKSNIGCLLNYKSYGSSVLKDEPDINVIKFFKTKKLAENAIKNLNWKYKNAEFIIQKVKLTLEEII